LYARPCRPFLLLLLALFSASSTADQEHGLAFKEIAPGIYLRPGVQEVADAANRGHIANLGFIVGQERVAVIDSGGSRAEGEAVLRAVRSVTDLPVAYLILTHMHPDHVLGSGAFADQGIEIIGHANLADALVRRQSFYLDAALEHLGNAAVGTRIALPESGVAAGQVRELALGDRVLELRGYPTAHTNNDLTVLDRTTGTLWLSDLLFVERIPVVDGSLLGWLRVMDEIAMTDAATVIPGHGPIGPGWKAALERQKRYLETIAEGARREIQGGGDIRRTVETVGREERDNWLLFDDYHGRNVTAAFVELEWE